MDIDSDESSNDKLDDEDDGTKARSETATAKKHKRQQPFIENWLQLPQFKEWLVRRIGKDQKPKPYYELRQKQLTCSKTGIT